MSQNRTRSNRERQIPQLAGLGQDFSDMYPNITAWDTGTAVDVPQPATQQGNDSWFTTVANAAKSIIPAYYAGQTQKDLNAINLERARKGMAPLPAAYMSATAPRINVGMAPDTQQLVFFGGLALAALIVLKMVSRR